MATTHDPLHAVPHHEVPEFPPDYTRTDSLDEVVSDSPRKHSCYPGVPTLGHGDMRFDTAYGDTELPEDPLHEVEPDLREQYRLALDRVIRE